MPYTQPYITNQQAGTPRQPIPLRLACLIITQTSDLSAEYPSISITLSMLSDGYDGGTMTDYQLLSGYEHISDDNVRVVQPNFYRNLIQQITDKTNINNNMELLPINHFVWSDELARAFNKYIDINIGREAASKSGFKLAWDTSYSPYDHLIEACSSFNEITPSIVRSKNKKVAKEVMYHTWHDEYAKIINDAKAKENILSTYGELSVRNIAKEISTRLYGDDSKFENIRKTLRNKFSILN